MKEDQLESQNMEDVEAALHVTDSGITLYANRAMLRVLSEKLQEIAKSLDDEFFEIHFPDEFYSDVQMFNEGVNRNVEIVLSESVANLFKDVPVYVDIDGQVLKPRYGLTIMHNAAPLSTVNEGSAQKKKQKKRPGTD